MHSLHILLHTFLETGATLSLTRNQNVSVPATIYTDMFFRVIWSIIISACQGGGWYLRYPSSVKGYLDASHTHFHLIQSPDGSQDTRSSSYPIYICTPATCSHIYCDISDVMNVLKYSNSYWIVIIAIKLLIYWQHFAPQWHAPDFMGHNALPRQIRQFIGNQFEYINKPTESCPVLDGWRILARVDHSLGIKVKISILP